MKKFTSGTLIFSLLFSAGAMAAEPQNGSGETDGYHLVWQDLFDGEELNLLRWDIEVNGAGGGNNELQYYTDRPENVRLGKDTEGNGCLILTARRENYLGKNFTSGRINSKNRIAFTHGKLEAAIKLDPTANGLWPAFWTMGNDFDAVGWPKCGETDIMEFGHATGIANNTTDRYFNGASHWGVRWDKKGDHARSVTKSYSLQDGKFHLYTLIWNDKEMKMYVDLDKQPIQTPYYSIDISYVNPEEELCAGNYFHKDNFILFNLAVGGNFPNIHKPEGITALNDANNQQASMYVNYVKIYQKGEPGETTDFLDPGDPIDSSSIATISNLLDISITKQDSTYIAKSTQNKIVNLTLSGIDGKEIASATNSLDINPEMKGIYILHAFDGVTDKTLKIIQ